MDNIIHRLRSEPVVLRVALAAVLDVLVVGGIIDVSDSEALEAAIVAAVNLTAAFSARRAVRPLHNAQ